jgi:shikimate dehydrogenase
MAIIGSPVEHSLSPLIQNAFARRAGLDYAYMGFNVKPEGLGAFTAAARTLNMVGFNVTMPLKEKIAPFLDELDSSACGGAVNTVYARDGRLIGGNTDGAGFVLSMERAGGLPGTALILGAGGSARALAASLTAANVSVTVASRRTVRFDLPRTDYIAWDDFPARLPDCGLLINATPLGMHGADAGDYTDLDFLDALPADACAYDLIYAPPVTALLAAAARRGLRTVNGLPHLVCQGALAFKLFTGHMPSEADIDEALRLAGGGG